MVAALQTPLAEKLHIDKVFVTCHMLHVTCHIGEMDYAKPVCAQCGN